VLVVGSSPSPRRADAAVQDVVEELIRWIGYTALRLVTFGRYRGGTRNDRLPQGAVGLGIVAGLTYLVYAFGTWSGRVTNTAAKAGGARA
jgi:hypothetical protein